MSRPALAYAAREGRLTVCNPSEQLRRAGSPGALPEADVDEVVTVAVAESVGCPVEREPESDLDRV